MTSELSFKTEGKIMIDIRVIHPPDYVSEEPFVAFEGDSLSDLYMDATEKATEKVHKQIDMVECEHRETVGRIYLDFQENDYEVEIDN